MMLPATSRRPALAIPDALRRQMIAGHGEPATQRWLDALPSLLDAWCERWDITLGPETPPPSVNLVLFGSSPRVGDVVLKLNLPSSEVASEIEALAQAAGDGMVRLIDASPSTSVMMLARIRPGTMLIDVDMPDRDSTLIAIDVLRRFWRRPVRYDNLHPLDTWFRSLLTFPRGQDSASPIPERLIERAIVITERLLADPEEPVLLHGDLHHQNILRDGAGGWVTIDPKGLVGERGYDITSWMLNPPGVGSRPDLASLLSARLDLFATGLGIDRRRLTAWTFMHAVLSMCWTVEGGGPRNLAEDVRCAELLATELNSGG